MLFVGIFLFVYNYNPSPSGIIQPEVKGLFIIERVQNNPMDCLSAARCLCVVMLEMVYY